MPRTTDLHPTSDLPSGGSDSASGEPVVSATARAGRLPTSVVFASGLMLGVGLVAGLLLRSVSLPEAGAENLSPQQVQSISRELQDKSGTLWDASDKLSKVVKLAAPSVVHIESQYKDERGSNVDETGSGVLVHSRNRSGLFVITNGHVVAEAGQQNITIGLADGREVHPVQVWIDKATDLAVLRLGITDAPAVRFADSDQADIGHLVLAMGSPFGLSQSVTLGIISARGRRSLSLGKKDEVINQNFMQTDAAINPGNSGGPLIDLNGQVVGINTAIASNSGGSEGIGFAIPSNLVQHVFEQIVTYGRVKRAYLGVKLDPKFDLAAAVRLGLDRVRGARVLAVLPNTPAANAQLKYDDVILSFGGKAVEDESDLINRVSLMPVGTRIDMEVLRGRRRVRLQVTLSGRPTQTAKSPVTDGSQFTN